MILLNTITRHKTNYYTQTQQYNKIRHTIVTLTIILKHCNITKQHKKAQNSVRKYKQYRNITKQHNKTQKIFTTSTYGYIITYQYNKAQNNIITYKTA